MNSVLDPSLVLYLPLNTLDGNSFMSREASGHLVANTGSVWISQGRSFDGTNDLLNCGVSPSFNSQQYTLTCWFRTIASSPNTDVGHRLVNVSRVVGGETKIALRLRNNIADLFWITPVPSVDSVSTGMIVNDGQWYNLAGTTDGTTFTIYLNGDYKASKLSTLHTDFYSLSIGAIHTSFGAYIGLIGEARVYNRALTNQEIQYIYLATKQRYR